MKAFAFLALLFPALAAAAPVELINPMKAELPAGLSDADADKVIRLAFLDLGWTIRKTAPGSVVADLALREHEVTIEAKYDAKTVALHYVDSVEVGYEPCRGNRFPKGAQCIHPNYHGWLQNVLKALPNAKQKLELFGTIGAR